MTIADYDLVIVMDKGSVVEFGAPYELLQSKGLFTEMVSYSGKSRDAIWEKARIYHDLKRRQQKWLNCNN